MYAMSILEKIDPTHSIFAGRLGRESLVIEKGQLIKDLKYLNRDPRRVVVVEKDPTRLKNQPENGLYVPEFNGDTEDKTLFEILPFLDYLARQDVRDVREEIKKFGPEEPAKRYLEGLKRAREQAQSRRGGLSNLVRPRYSN
eukprot:TRINITY_DN8565_c0_g3_i2.p1 TRINITY_DN8565_c0_g3~~TRINITY_DN8565_c0_g3_i2.p1  ORF type:complete len:142 (+),score=46.37 TRINITY_DN8565_c0_g3_i2:159-584(+)